MSIDKTLQNIKDEIEYVRGNKLNWEFWSHQYCTNDEVKQFYANQIDYTKRKLEQLTIALKDLNANKDNEAFKYAWENGFDSDWGEKFHIRIKYN